MKKLRMCVDRVLPRDTARRIKLLRDPKAEKHTTRLAIIGDKRWVAGQKLSVSFLDGDADVQDKVVSYAKQWEEFANLKLEFGDRADADIRVSFLLDGSWSYLGTDALAFEDPEEATVNFGWFDSDTDEAEFKRVILHEFGHALGAIHEHQSPAAAIPWNKEAVLDFYMGPPNHWDQDAVSVNIFEMYDQNTTQHSKFDPESIMLYPIEAELVTDPDSVVGWNDDLSDGDKSFMRESYP